MLQLAVQIVRFVDDHFPGWVECELIDAEGRCHTFVEKIPVVTEKDLGPDSEYPTPGTLRCEVLKRYHDEKGQEMVRVSTTSPWSIESTEGSSEFTVPATLIASIDD